MAQDYIPRDTEINKSPDEITVIQGDHLSRFVRFKFFDKDREDQPLNMIGCRAFMYFQFDGAVGYIEGEVVDTDNTEELTGVVTFLLPNGVTQYEGKWDAQVRIINPTDGSILHAYKCKYIVLPSLYDEEAIEATGQYQALDKALINVNLANIRIDNLISSGTVDGELIDIRATVDGIYPTAGDAVRAQYGAVRNAIVRLGDDYCEPYQGIIVEQGFIDSFDGSDDVSLHAVRTSAQTMITGNFVVSNPHGFEISIARYGENEEDENETAYVFEELERHIGDHPMPGSATRYTDTVINFAASENGKAYRVRCYSGSNDIYITPAQSGLKIFQSTGIFNAQKLHGTPNLNDYMYTGAWYKPSTVTAANSPAQDGGFLTVTSSEGTNIIQRYITNRQVEYTRIMTTSGGWGDWKEMSPSYSLDQAAAGIFRSSENVFFQPFVTAAAGMSHLVRPDPDSEYVAVDYDVGETVAMIPYSSTFYCGGDVLFNRTPATFYSAVKNPYSVLYTRRGGRGDNKSNYYGVVCSTFAEGLIGDPTYKVSRVLVREDNPDYSLVNVTDITDLRPGMILASGTHELLIVDVGFSAEGEAMVTTLEATKPRIRKQTITYDFLVTDYIDRREYAVYEYNKLSSQRERGEMIKRLKVEPYAENVITEFGNNTWFLKNSDIWLYIPETSTPMSQRRLMFRVKGASSWSSTEIVIDGTKHMMLAPSEISSAAANYELTTGVVTGLVGDQEIIALDDTGDIYCCINVVDVGTGSYADGVISVSGYSENCVPVWYQKYYRFDTTDEYYYKDINGKKMFIVEENGQGLMEPDANGYSADFTVPETPTAEMTADFFESATPPYPDYLGWCVRVYFQTGYGYCWKEIYP